MHYNNTINCNFSLYVEIIYATLRLYSGGMRFLSYHR